MLSGTASPIVSGASGFAFDTLKSFNTISLMMNSCSAVKLTVRGAGPIAGGVVDCPGA